MFILLWESTLQAFRFYAGSVKLKKQRRWEDQQSGQVLFFLFQINVTNFAAPSFYKERIFNLRAKCRKDMI